MHRMALRFLIAFTFFVNLDCGGEDDPGNTDMGASTGDPTTGDPTTPTTGDDLPPAETVCANACATFAACTGATPTCVSDCEAGIEFMATNNPGTGCATYETGRMDCLSHLTCEELDAIAADDPGSEQLCRTWIDLESDRCAIE